VVKLLHDGHLLTDEKESVLGLLGSLVGEAHDGGIGSAEACPVEAAKLPRAVAEDIGLGPFSEPCLGERLDSLERVSCLLHFLRDGTHIFGAELVRGQVDGAIRAAADFILEDVLVDVMVCAALGVLVGVLGARI
jgi:hypothetical protein